jgi:hypothetical protein
VIKQGFSDGRIFHGGARATPAGVAPEALEELWDSFDGCIGLGLYVFDPPFSEGCCLLVKPLSFDRSFFCRHQLALAGSFCKVRSITYPRWGRASSSLVSCYRVVQVRTHALFDKGWL